jgi:2-amino-4-hydroxy-6-hydroxymethyldihydropteridine diphosphokinase
LKAWIGLGSNLEDSLGHLTHALEELAATPGITLEARSRFYRTGPVGYLDQPDFINAVARLETELPAPALLDVLQHLETRHGRQRTFANAPRTLDLDLLLYGNQHITTPRLEVPHLRMHERAFVLIPLLELEPRLTIPGRGPVATLAQALGHQSIAPVE